MTNGEMAWRWMDLPLALEAIQATNQVLLGGEVWIVVNNATLHEVFHSSEIPRLGVGRDGSYVFGIIPTSDGHEAVFHWEITERQPPEAWIDFVGRSIRDTLEAVADHWPQDSLPPKLADHLWYCLSYCSEEEWGGLMRDKT